MVKALFYGVVYYPRVKHADRDLRDLNVPANASYLSDGSKDGKYSLHPEATNDLKASVSDLKMFRGSIVSINRPSIICLEDGRAFVRDDLSEDHFFKQKIPSLIEELKANLEDLLSKAL